MRSLRRLGTLSHLSHDLRPVMVDVGEKRPSKRVAVATATLLLPKASADALCAPPELRVLATTASVAGTLAAKRTDALIPMCHTLPVDAVDITVTGPTCEGGGSAHSRLLVTARVSTTAKTGVEMEAFVGATMAALTLLDMLKSACPPGSISLTDVRLLEKTGGKRDFRAQ